MPTWIGIDPGLGGAFGAIEENGRVHLFDTPTLQIGTKRDYNMPKMREILTGWKDPRVVIESVHALPGQGVTSMFNFGKGFGIWLGLLAGLEIPFDLVTPQRWKKVMLDGVAKDKDAARLRAMSLFPRVADRLERVMDDGRAESLLMAEYLRRLHGGR